MADDRPALGGLPYPTDTYNKESEAAFRREVDRSMQSMEAFVHNKVTSLNISTDTPTDDDILVWDDATGLWVPEAQATGPLLALATLTVANSSVWETFITITVPETGFYAVDGFLYHYGTTADDFRLQLLYNSTGDGRFIYDQGTHYEALTNEGAVFTGIGQTAPRGLQVVGYLDAQSISGDPTFVWRISNKGTGSGSAIAYAGSWLRIHRTGDT